MRTHIWMIIMAVALTACASRRDVASVNQHDEQIQQEQVERAQLLDAQSSRIR